MATCLEVAKYFLHKTDPNVGDTISNLKLQKLVYYAQGFSLAILETTLFEENIKAWDHGPVVSSLYYEYKKYEAEAIPPVSDLGETSLTEEQIELLDEVYEVYGQFSAWALRNMTHSEPPWSETAKNEEISIESMSEYFKTRIM